MKTRSTTPTYTLLALAIDIVLITIFAAIGRGEHDRAATFTGLFETTWPFVAGLILSWLVMRMWRRPFSIVRAGIPAWIGAVTLGMLFRALTGQGTALPFILVATGTLALFLIGWRIIPTLAIRRKTQNAQG